MSENLLEDWTFEQPIDFEVGETYIVRANHKSGKFWADLLITVTSRISASQSPEGTEQGVFGFELETILDGSPGLLEGFSGGELPADAVKM